MSRKDRPWPHNVNARVRVNDRSMSNGLMSTRELKMYDHCCGIHGAARERRSAKKATSSARRRNDKLIVMDALSDG